MADRRHLCIVGGGIVGLAHACLATEQGWRVTVFERGRIAEGASIRNFGMIWPVGQPAGQPLATALASRRRWLRLAADAGIRAEAVGSIHIARREDEWTVFREFAERGPELGYDVKLLSAREVQSRSPAAADGLIGGLWSGTEVAVDPPEAVAGVARWLADQRDVAFAFDTAVTSAETGTIRTADGRNWPCDRVVICGGADFETLFPEVFAAAQADGLTRCKLQMLSTGPQPGGFRIGPHLAGGLTLRHYRSFEICPSLSVVRERVTAEAPELDRYGIHVMASQDAAGRVILGDSHEYDAEMSPFDSGAIEALMLRELRQLIDLPDWTIERRWHGVYAKYPAALQLALEPVPEVWIRTGPGGAGMTLSFGLAERDWNRG
jgi:D-hydroxyproline dehydrogenase subunit beta